MVPRNDGHGTSGRYPCPSVLSVTKVFYQVSKTAMVTTGRIIMTVVPWYNGYRHGELTNIIDHCCFLRVCIFKIQRVE